MGHSHDHGDSLGGRRLVLSIFLTLAFVAGEAIAGYFSHSLALLSDAGHNFADALALIAIAMNTIISLWLRSDATYDLNVRSAYMHMLGDAISAAGVVVAGLVV